MGHDPYRSRDQNTSSGRADMAAILMSKHVRSPMPIAKDCDAARTMDKEARVKATRGKWAIAATPAIFPRTIAWMTSTKAGRTAPQVTTTIQILAEAMVSDPR